MYIQNGAYVSSIEAKIKICILNKHFLANRGRSPTAFFVAMTMKRSGEN